MTEREPRVSPFTGEPVHRLFLGRYSCDICGRRTSSVYAVRDGQWACGACAGPDPDEVVE